MRGSSCSNRSGCSANARRQASRSEAAGGLFLTTWAAWWAAQAAPGGAMKSWSMRKASRRHNSAPMMKRRARAGKGGTLLCRPPRWPFITAAPLRQHHVSPCCSAEVSMQLRHALRPVAAAALGTWQRRHRRTRCSAAAAALGAVPLPQVLVPRTTPPVRQDEWCVADGDLRRRVLTPSLPARSSQGQHGGLDRQAAGMDIF